jgi:nucleoside-diphosphate-sugar epimerase
MAESIPRGPVFLTGAAGFLGANLARKLVSLHIPTHILIKKTSDLSRIEDIRSSLVFHYEDLHDIGRLTKLLTAIKPKTIFHLAANGAYENQNNPLQITQTNHKGRRATASSI